MSDTENYSTIEYTLHIKPLGKGRPRAVRRGRHITLYTPAATKEYEAKVHTDWVENVKTQVKADYYDVGIVFYIKMPKSFTAKQRKAVQDVGYRHNKKPDIDNLGKAILDALNGIAYPDDCMICDLNQKKRYSDDQDSIHIRISNALHMG